MSEGWKQIPRLQPCPVCAHMGGYCTIAPDGTAVQCMRTPSNHPIQRKDGTVGYLHPMPGEAAAMAKSLPSAPDKPKISPKKWEQVCKKYRSAISDKLLRATASELGVSEESLLKLNIGLDVGCDWWRGTRDPCFPMYDGKRDVIGIRTRTPNASLRPGRDRYGCVRGSSNGLFIPSNYEVVPLPPGLCGVEAEGDNDECPLLAVPEGPTSTAATLDLGFRAIGRPSATGGALHIHALLLNGNCKQDIVIFAERDETKYLRDGTPFWPGEEGALSIASQILSACGRLRIILPPTGKDIRQWMVEGGQREVLTTLINSTEFVDKQWLAERRELIQAWKVRLKRKAVA